MEIAETSQRFKNHLIDTIISVVLTFLFYGIAVAIFDFDNKDEIFSSNFFYLVLGLRTLYCFVFEYYFFRTIGKVITKTKVQTIEGTVPNFKTILIRSLCRLIPFNSISYLFGIGWHDGISKTVVIKDSIG